MLFKHLVPILYSSDIRRSIAYYTEVLGFDNKWEWSSPPTFGGVSKDHVEIFFCKDGQGNPGTWMSIFIKDTDEYYETIKAKGAKIITPPKTYEWGVREMLVEDPDGHRIRFGHSASARHGKSEPKMPAGVHIIARNPTTEEYLSLLQSVGWGYKYSEEAIQKILSAPLFAVVAEHRGKAIGCALLLGDGVTFFYVKDVMVDPAWQAKRVGSGLMQAITDWVNENGGDNALVALITGEGLFSFYHPFGFRPAFAMQRRVKGRE
jgi:uncharacterized glyoxalase superfamily protein PhnB/GNAT superfamily N-acetyltransferase